MLDVLTGFVVVGLAIVVGYILGRIDLLGPHARHVLSRLTFYVLSPFLLFTVLAQADVHSLFSALLPVSAIAAVVVIAVQGLLARLVWRRSIPETVISALSAGQVNSNNIGIPLSLYLLGSAAFPAPVILMQLLLFTPLTLGILDATTSGERSFGRILTRTVTNPIVVGSVLGTLVSVFDIDLPPVILEPSLLIANACVPVLLISYGISLHGQRVLGAAGHRAEVVVASALKLIVMPVIAWGVATMFGLSAADTLVVVVLAALPTAQNVFNYAQRYGVGETVSRDTILLTTIGCVPVLIAAVLLFQ
ncbi:AEC family transporter [Microbacterium sp. cx-55]|uniref:AEC family transporter n=1 Tax=unclassified Microbacterium TaxID=2609290 RepID=UPI001CC0AD8A|nr:MULTISPECIES: AEC family transporter [unclassified Microbacterium]MBZ4486448.1 AEC family transporter [Microbacterium sp. cx-55]MCC4907420.1 AEC family transporter [Microbacterium sp. cx-59]UGB36580.1 AEC family transporter [Microbacterium sp. cx-55]